jgi:hypothetical protein
VRQEVAQPERGVVADQEELLEALMELEPAGYMAAVERVIQTLLALLGLMAQMVLFALSGAQVAHSQAQIL